MNKNVYITELMEVEKHECTKKQIKLCIKKKCKILLTVAYFDFEVAFKILRLSFYHIANLVFNVILPLWISLYYKCLT